MWDWLMLGGCLVAIGFLIWVIVQMAQGMGGDDW
jgi:hypothetical protein